MASDYEKDGTAGFNELLKSVVELSICTQQHIANDLHDKVVGSTLDKDIFVYRFLTRMNDIAASVVIVSKGGGMVKVADMVFGSNENRYTDAALLARSALEGLWDFHAFKKNSSAIARRWFLYTIYESYQRRIRIERIDPVAVTEARESACKWLKMRYSPQDINAADTEFPFKEPNHTWYEQKGIHELANAFCDESVRLAKRHNTLNGRQRSEWLKNCKKLYAVAYGDISGIAHWSPLGIGGSSPLGSFVNEERLDIRFLPSIVFESLFMMADYANTEYDLGYDKELRNILEPYQAIQRKLVSPGASA